MSKAEPFFMSCNRCGEGQLTVALIPQHAIHVFCDACEITVMCLTPDKLTKLIADPSCTLCGSHSGSEVDGHG